MLLNHTSPTRILRFMFWSLLLSPLAACDYPPVLKSAKPQPPQPLLAEFVGHAPVVIVPPAPVASSSQSMSAQTVPSMELKPINIPLADAHTNTDKAESSITTRQLVQEKATPALPASQENQLVEAKVTSPSSNNSVMAHADSSKTAMTVSAPLPHADMSKTSMVVREAVPAPNREPLAEVNSDKSVMASKDDVKAEPLALDNIGADGKVNPTWLAEKGTLVIPPKPIPQPGNLDVQNAQDLHQLRIQLMAESP